MFQNYQRLNSNKNMNRYKTWKAQGEYKTLGLQGNKKGVKMILVLDEKTGATVLEPLIKIPICAIPNCQITEHKHRFAYQK